jgi:hypothetical protein
MQIDALSMIAVVTGAYALRELALRVLDALYVLNSYHIAAQGSGERHD